MDLLAWRNGQIIKYYQGERQKQVINHLLSHYHTSFLRLHVFVSIYRTGYHRQAWLEIITRDRNMAEIHINIAYNYN